MSKYTIIPEVDNPTGNEVNDLWRACKEHGRNKKRSNQEYSTQLLIAEGIPFVSYSNGNHLFVGGTFDFWPSTGYFKHRKTGKAGRGVRNLINLISKNTYSGDRQ